MLKDVVGVGCVLVVWVVRSLDGYVGSWIDNMMIKFFFLLVDRYIYIIFD